MKIDKKIDDSRGDGSSREIGNPLLIRPSNLLYSLSSLFGLFYASLSLYFALAIRTRKRERTTDNPAVSGNKLVRHLGLLCGFLVLTHFGSNRAGTARLKPTAPNQGCDPERVKRR